MNPIYNQLIISIKLYFFKIVTVALSIFLKISKFIVKDIRMVVDKCFYRIIRILISCDIYYYL